MSDSRAKFEAWFEARQMPAEWRWFIRCEYDKDDYDKAYVSSAWEVWQACDAELEAERAKLAEAQAMIAMQSDLIWRAHGELLTNNSDYVELVGDLNRAISATAETVAAWKAKEIEPLRREVAMQYGLLCELQNALTIGTALHREVVKAINYTQATALAYEQEVAAKARTEFVEELRGVPSIGLSERQFGELQRAASNKEKLGSTTSSRPA